jgi:hypothetical protein
MDHGGTEITDARGDTTQDIYAKDGENKCRRNSLVKSSADASFC